MVLASESGIVVSNRSGYQHLRIKVTDASPEFARDFSNALASSYDNMLTGIAKNSKTVQREFIESQIPINDRMLSLASDALGDFRENSDIIQLTDKSSMLVEQISYYALRLEPLRLQLAESQVFIDSYSASLKQAGVEGVLSLVAPFGCCDCSQLNDLKHGRRAYDVRVASKSAGNTATTAPTTVLNSSSACM